MEKIDQAAHKLNGWLFGRQPQFIGFVGAGANILHVYISATSWPNEQVNEFEGYKVIWHLGAKPEPCEV